MFENQLIFILYLTSYNYPMFLAYISRYKYGRAGWLGSDFLVLNECGLMANNSNNLEQLEYKLLRNM